MTARALMVLRVRIPPPPADDTFAWLLQPDSADHTSTWYVDGSVYDATRGFARRAGFGLVVVGESGELIGVVNGTPPCWVNYSAGAEVWAFFSSRLAVAFPPADRDRLPRGA